MADLIMASTRGLRCMGEKLIAAIIIGSLWVGLTVYVVIVHLQ